MDDRVLQPINDTCTNDIVPTGCKSVAWGLEILAMATMQDDELRGFETNGAPLLPNADKEGYAVNDGARIWYRSYGSGVPVILLHGGLGHSGNWAYQVQPLVETSYRAVLIDSRGHGRSTRDQRPFSYKLMASDVLAVMDTLGIEKACLLGWSDGACTAIVLAGTAPSRVSGVFFFACNMDPSGLKAFEATPTLNRCFARHTRDYVELSPTPEHFQELVTDLSVMQRSQPNYTANDLAKIPVPVAIVQSENDEFIRHEHSEYLARSIPGAEYIVLDGVSHFAPLQRPELFSGAILAFLRRIHAGMRS